MKDLVELEVNPPIRIGEKIIKNLMGTGVNVVTAGLVNRGLWLSNRLANMEI